MILSLRKKKVKKSIMKRKMILKRLVEIWRNFQVKKWKKKMEIHLSRSCSVNLFPRSRKISRGDWECHASSIEASECYAQFMLKYLQIPTPHFVQENLLQMNSFSSSDFKVQEIVSESVRQFAIGTCWSLRHWIYDGVAAWGHFPCTRPLWTCHLWKLALGLCDVQLGSDFNM